MHVVTTLQLHDVIQRRVQSADDAETAAACCGPQAQAQNATHPSVSFLDTKVPHDVQNPHANLVTVAATTAELAECHAAVHPYCRVGGGARLVSNALSNLQAPIVAKHSTAQCQQLGSQAPQQSALHVTYGMPRCQPHDSQLHDMLAATLPWLLLLLVRLTLLLVLVLECAADATTAVSKGSHKPPQVRSCQGSPAAAPM